MYQINKCLLSRHLEDHCENDILSNLLYFYIDLYSLNKNRINLNR